MDPISTAIIAALTTGVVAGAAHVAEQAIKDAYGALKAKLQARFGDESKVAQAVDTLEQEPDFRPHQQALAARLEQVKAAEDAELQKLSQALKEAIEQTPKGQQAYIRVRDSQVGVIGDHTEIKGGIHFGKKS